MPINNSSTIYKADIMNYCVEYNGKVALFSFYNDALMFCRKLKKRDIQHTLSRAY